MHSDKQFSVPSCLLLYEINNSPRAHAPHSDVLFYNRASRSWTKPPPAQAGRKHFCHYAVFHRDPKWQQQEQRLSVLPQIFILNCFPCILFLPHRLHSRERRRPYNPLCTVRNSRVCLLYSGFSYLVSMRAKDEGVGNRREPQRKWGKLWGVTNPKSLQVAANLIHLTLFPLCRERTPKTAIWTWLAFSIHGIWTYRLGQIEVKTILFKSFVQTFPLIIP